MACFGESALVDDAPTGTGFTQLAVGGSVACVAKDGQTPVCWRDEEACPALDATPAGLDGLTAGGCQVCGTDSDEFGVCGPRKWYGERISYAGL